MLRHPLLLLFVCLVFAVTAYDASAKSRQLDTAESAKSAKAASVKKTSGKSGAAKSAKKGSKKQEIQGSTKAKSPKVKNSASRKKRSTRDAASLPIIDEEFAEKPNTVLSALSSIPADGRFSSPFGMRHQGKHVHMHTGVDISAERGTPVFAAASGVVRFAGQWDAYGRIVEIDHGNGLVTRYAHLDSFSVDEGAKVASGAQIGTVGRSGRTTGANLHFETLVNGKAVNPMMAEMWQRTPTELAAKRGTYVSGLRSTSKHVYY